MLAVELAPELPAWVAGDQIRLRQVQRNVISNALKFTSQGSITITAGLEKALPDGYLVRMAVRDSGIGISPEGLRRLFGAFAQADASINRRYGGTGLGLAISKKLVELMGGAIEVESQPGQGATFSFTPRLGRAEAVAALTPEQSSADLGRLRVLLAEDNKINQQVGLRLLKKLGVAATIAGRRGRSHSRDAAGRVRFGTDGCADARSRRHHRHPRDSPPSGGLAVLHLRAQRARRSQFSTGMPHRGHGPLPDQAHRVRQVAAPAGRRLRQADRTLGNLRCVPGVEHLAYTVSCESPAVDEGEKQEEGLGSIR